MAITKIHQPIGQSEVDKVEHIYRNGVDLDCREEYRDIRVIEEYGCYSEPEEGDNDPMNWGAGESSWPTIELGKRSRY